MSVIQQEVFSYTQKFQCTRIVLGLAINPISLTKILQPKQQYQGELGSSLKLD